MRQEFFVRKPVRLCNIEMIPISFISLPHEMNISKLVFQRGMLFGTRERWWKGTGLRNKPHEGIDILYYSGKSGTVKSINEGCIISSVSGGTVVSIIDDFIDRSVFIAHDVFSDGRRLHSIYAHISPGENIFTGCSICKGEIIGKVAPAAGKKSKILPHLHFSLAWIRQDFPPEMLRWEILWENEGITLINPINHLNYPFIII